MSGTGWHSSGAKVDTGKLDEQIKENYDLIAKTIANNGWENDTFPKDIDIDYKTLHSLLDEKLEGLGTILKNMKRRKLVDFHSAAFFKDDTIVTLITDYYQEFNPQIVLYEQLGDAVEKDDSSHLKVQSWA
mmetsp:Transcript_377/g.475  ORF Transcript_377/g.475 Transcript_377/m.475 type:complete len:131 (+) Transcript_377:33-425(+)|eukprot:CAMPEP_0201551820 /NCGR_PEP_ID=MMETSP0173_2-20130828/10573_1 /ASSEMBLY_ACC=CAM_ASM_000268 /TAXON_ID=218659 /ORGANISM="Vexillifera sp., Strain DIVA3 564/2" /LENGTH=130 /DNA_ID=CAMNT_0047962165 /DNA_START=32 /DNA_END=424 /DNA_ORIENTATION=-